MASIGLINTLILLGAVLALAGILSSLVASRFGAPLLLVFLVIGMLGGEEGPGHVVFSDYLSTYVVGSLALAVILFDGGLRTKFASFRVALRPALVLATAGVVLTAGITGLIAMPLLDLRLLEGLLLGAIVASTDGAAVFFLLRTGGLQLKQRVGTTLEIESGTNDPVAVFLTIVIVEMLLAGAERPGWSVLGSLGDQALVGSVLGVGGGLATSWVLNHADLPSGLQPVFVTTASILIFALASVAGGSGFLAIYLAGLVVGNRPIRGFASVTSFHDAATWLAQIIMFVLLGLLVTPSQLVAHALPALGIALGLMLVARPVAVWLCLLPFRFSRREKGFISWVGLRGAVSIFLASVPMLSGLPRAELYFNVAFFVVLVSLLVQGWTTLPSARWLDVALPRVRHQVRRVELDLPDELGYEMVGYPVPEDSPILHHARIPDWARLVFVVRDHRVVTPLQAGALQEGDHVYFVVPPWRVQVLDHLFAPPDEIDEADRDFFGEFTFDGDLHLGSLATLYGIEVPAAVADRTLAEHFARSINEHPVIGDRLSLGGSALIVREVEGDRVAKVGLRLETPEPRHARLDWLRAVAARAVMKTRRLVRPKGGEP